MRLVGAALRGLVSPPVYRHDIIEQFDLIGVGSLTVVLLTGFFTGAALAFVPRQRQGFLGVLHSIGSASRQRTFAQISRASKCDLHPIPCQASTRFWPDAASISSYISVQLVGGRILIDGDVIR